MCVCMHTAMTQMPIRGRLAGVTLSFQSVDTRELVVGTFTFGKACWSLKSASFFESLAFW